MAGGERLEEVQEYYEKILPFYEKEAVARAHLDFWQGLARHWRPARILEIGSGLGRITAALGRHAPAIGIDISLEMLWHAVRRCPRRSRARFLAADMRRVAFDCRFDLIVAPSDPFSHLLGSADRVEALRGVANQLTDSGHFVLEGLYRSRRAFKPPVRRISHSSGTLSVSENWQPIGTPQLWRASYRYRDRRPGRPDRALEASFVARAWEPRMLRPLFASCGLAVEEMWGDLDRRPFSRDSRRIVVVARRLTSVSPARVARRLTRQTDRRDTPIRVTGRPHYPTRNESLTALSDPDAATAWPLRSRSGKERISMRIYAVRDSEEVRAFRLNGFRRGVGFQPSSIEVDQRMELALEFDDEDEEPENLEDKDLDTEDTLPSRRRTAG